MRPETSALPKSGRATSGYGLLLAAVLGVAPVYKLANLLTAVRFIVHGDSMQPSFARNQYILVSRLVCLRDGMGRGDVVVLRHRTRNYIKRIVGLPEEHVRVEGGRVFIDGRLLEEPYLSQESGCQDSHCGDNIPLDDSTTGTQEDLESLAREWTLDKGQFFVMGDNRANSDDSRSFGPLERELIVGKAWIRYWPRSAWGFLT